MGRGEITRDEQMGGFFHTSIDYERLSQQQSSRGEIIFLTFTFNLQTMR